jgi:hypothetical protein
MPGWRIPEPKVEPVASFWETMTRRRPKLGERHRPRRGLVETQTYGR